jgi:hypothetical protein
MSTPLSTLPPKKRPVAAAAAAAPAAQAAPAQAAAGDANHPPPPSRVTIDPLNLLGTHEPRDRFGDPLPRPAKEPRLADDADFDSDAEEEEEEEEHEAGGAAADEPPTTSAGIAAARRTGKIHGLVAEYRAPRIGAQYQATLPPPPPPPTAQGGK